MESKFNRVFSISTLYPEKSEKLPQTGIIKLPRKYEKVRQISNGSFTSVFCVKDRGKIGTIYAAKFMKDQIKNDNEEVEILKALQNCEQIPKIIDVFHSDYQTILITEYFAGKNFCCCTTLFLLLYNIIFIVVQHCLCCCTTLFLLLLKIICMIQVL